MRHWNHKRIAPPYKPKWSRVLRGCVSLCDTETTIDCLKDLLIALLWWPDKENGATKQTEMFEVRVAWVREYVRHWNNHNA